MIDRKVFFAHVRQIPAMRGSLSQPAVVTMDAVLDEWEKRGLSDIRWLAYMFATILAETGVNMSPVREGFKKTDADARAFIQRQGYKYAKIVNGHMYYGRGLVQLTWDYNYKNMGAILKIDLAANPDLALQPPIAVKIMFEGMIRGTFTTKKLSQFFNDNMTDPVNARTIINGHDRAGEIAGYYRSFLEALRNAYSGSTVARPPSPIVPVPVNIPPPKPKVQEMDKGKQGVVAAILALCAVVLAFAGDHPFITAGIVAAGGGVVWLGWRWWKNRGS